MYLVENISENTINNNNKDWHEHNILHGSVVVISLKLHQQGNNTSNYTEKEDYVN